MEFTLKTTIDASPKEIYNAWLNSEGHTLMTGSEAFASEILGDSFKAWEGYIEGKNILLEPFKRIKQTWRTSQFQEDEEDSFIEIVFNDLNGKTELVLNHTNLPESGEQYIEGWKEFYFLPMKSYFK